MSSAQATVSPSSTSSSSSSSPAPAASTAPGKTTITSSDDAALRARLIQHAGATFDDGGHYLWQIQPGGDFVCTQQPPTATHRSVDHAITQAQNLVSWRQLGACAMVQLEPAAAHGASPAAGAPATGAAPGPGASPAPDAAPPTSADPAVPAAPAAQSGFSLEGFLDAMFAGVASLFDVGSQVGAPASSAPASGAPAVAPGATPAGSQPAVPTPEPQMPGPSVPEAPPSASPKDVPALSQARWYDRSFKLLAATDVAAATAVLSSVFGIGEAATVVTTIDSETRKLGLEDGYFWFDASGQPISGGASAAQYIHFHFPVQSPVSPVAMWLGQNPPGSRPGYMQGTGSKRLFKAALGPKDGDSWTQVPDSAQQLDLRNIPGPLACFSTAEVMLAQAKVHEVAVDSADAIGGLVTSETYEPEKAKGHSYHYVDKVTTNPEAARKAKAYLDWELGSGNPVMVGVTYKDAKLNEGITDHWIVAIRTAGEGSYAFNDPATGGTGTLVWTTSDRFYCADRRYYASFVRPNESTLPAWRDHWKSLQPAAPGAAAPGAAAPGAAAP